MKGVRLKHQTCLSRGGGQGLWLSVIIATTMNRRLTELVKDYEESPENEKQFILSSIDGDLREKGFRSVEINGVKPWGGYIRFADENAEKFIDTFFPSISYEDAKLGNPEAELSPKILVVEPGKRLSWQKHARRAECWTFLTDGALYKSDADDNQGDLITMHAGDFVQLQAGERHRLVGGDTLTVVAEIWQHTDANSLSDEDDIVRIEDDFKRQ